MNELIMNALKPLNVPVYPNYYPGKAKTYITFFDYYSDPALNADDVKQRTSYYYQVDVWSETGSVRDQLAEQVEQALVNSGFIWRMGYGDYEPDEKVYHKAMRFYYAK